MYKEFYTLEETVRILSKARAYNNIRKAIKEYGLEGTEDKIKELYADKIQEYLLEILYEIWNKK